MPTHRPTPASFLRAVTCDLFTDGQSKWSQGKESECLSFRTKVEKLYPVLRCVNLVIAVLEIRFYDESGGIASLGRGCMIRASISTLGENVRDRAILARD